MSIRDSYDIKVVSKIYYEFKDSYAPCVLSPRLASQLIREVTRVSESIINLAILPGTDTLQEMIESINDGFYLIDGGNFESSDDDEYACQITHGYHIENGKIGLPIKNCMVWGFASDFLQTISKVGNDINWFFDEDIKSNSLISAGGAPSIKVLMNIGYV